MAVFKCKMCGGSLNIPEGITAGECPYCGTKQTLPRLDDDRRVNLYDRANHFRRNNDFDKAAGIYEQILNEDTNDAEAYWSLVLCRFGIEYVEDPATHRRVPTVNRTQYTSIFDDDNYKSALNHADAYQRKIYEDEANKINEIQKGILSISQKEEPFDVFICYKETDKNGQRTPDSVLANDLYHQLTQEGFKVFFSRITLEDKLGKAYEPYIFAALNSAKVMVVLGTKSEYFNAVWVKNEWSRYLSIVGQSGGKKVLIPAYKDMDPYDLPEEFSHLQAQDMSKLGFMQDLIRGITKIVGSGTESSHQLEPIIQQQGNSGNISALLKRGYIALEDGEWKSADGFFEEVLNQDPENAECYLGKWMAKSSCANTLELIEKYSNIRINAGPEKLTGVKAKTKHIDLMVKEYAVEGFLSESSIRRLYQFDTSYESVLRICKSEKDEVISKLESERLYNRAKQYASGEIKNTLDQITQSIIGTYDLRLTQAQEDDNRRIAEIKASYADFVENADVKAKEMYDNALLERENMYRSCIEQFNSARDARDFINAENCFERMKGYKNSDACREECKKRLEEIEQREKEEKRIENERSAQQKKKKKRIIQIAVASTATIAVACIAFFIVLNKVIIPNREYNTAVDLYNEGKYPEAIKAFKDMNGYKDSTDQITKCETAIKEEKYQKAVELYNIGKYSLAATEFHRISGYKDSYDQSKKCETAINEEKYNEAISLIEKGDFINSYESLVELAGYKDSAQKANDILIQYKKAKINDASVGDEVCFGSYEQDNDKSNGKEEIEWIVLEKKESRALFISKKALDCQPYDKNRHSTWKTCSLRKWLNGTFINNAFSSEEKAMIPKVTVSVDKYSFSKDKVIPGKSVKDRVFLLSIKEANNYFGTLYSRKCDCTSYCSIQGSYDDYDAGCWWWLRTPGTVDCVVASVTGEGVIYSDGVYADDPYGNGAIYGVKVDVNVRPAIWISLGS